MICSGEMLLDGRQKCCCVGCDHGQVQEKSSRENGDGSTSADSTNLWRETLSDVQLLLIVSIAHYYISSAKYIGLGRPRWIAGE